MKKIQVDKIEDGMVLAKPIVGNSGNILLNEGVILKKSMIPRLKNWDVPFVSVQSEVESVEEVAAPVVVEYKSDVLDEVFKDVIKNPIMKIILESTRDYFRNKYADENKGNKQAG